MSLLCWWSAEFAQIAQAAHRQLLQLNIFVHSIIGQIWTSSDLLIFIYVLAIAQMYVILYHQN